MNKEQLVNLPIEWKRGSGLSKSDLEVDGKNKCILYGELYTKHKELLIVSNNISRTNKIGTVSSKKGDILIPGTSTASKKDMLLAREVDEDGVFLGGDINIIRPSKGLFAKKYLPYYLETLTAYDQLDRYITGATGIIHISNTGIKNLKIPLPSIQEQQRIVSILDEAFAAIAKAKANAEQNLKNAKELFESYLQGVFDNKREDWEESSLKKEIDLLVGFAFKSKDYTDNKDDILLLRGDNIMQGSLRWEDVKRWKKSEYKEYIKYQLNENDIVLAMDRPWVKAGLKIARLSKNDLPALLVQRTACLRTKNNLDNSFLFHLLRSSRFMNYLKDVQTGIGVPHISGQQISDFTFYRPSLKSQKTIVQKLDTLSAETQKLEAIYQQKINDLEELKKSVLQKAFSGELKTSTALA
jgi:type I restriction enzyme S subunit